MRERISDLDHTYLRTEDDIFFCVSGNLHSKEAIFGMPYYFLTQELEEIMDITINEFVIIEDQRFTRLLSQISPEEYGLFIRDNYPDYYYSPPMWEILMKVNRPKVRQVLDPRRFTRRLRENYAITPEEENPLLYAIDQIVKHDVTLISNVGITGSVLLTQNPRHMGGDIDLVVYKRSNIEAARNFSSLMCSTNPRFSPLNGNKLQEYVQKKAARYGGAKADLYNLVAGRWDTIFIDGTKLDFTFVDDAKTDYIQSYDTPEVRPVNIQARVIGISDSYFLPTILFIEHEKFDKVIITARGYICLFQLHDIIKISGTEHASLNSETSYLVVDDLKGGAISIVDR